MSDANPPGENLSATSEHRPRGVALAPLWVASVLVLALAIAGLGAYLMMRQPKVVERVLPPPAQPDNMAEAARRAEALRARNLDLARDVEALRHELEQPAQCPPGTQLDPAHGIRKSALDGARGRQGVSNPCTGA